jgi:hypothetical protein
LFKIALFTLGKQITKFCVIDKVILLKEDSAATPTQRGGGRVDNDRHGGNGGCNKGVRRRGSGQSQR